MAKKPNIFEEVKKADVLILDRTREDPDGRHMNIYRCRHCKNDFKMEIPTPKFCPRCGTWLKKWADVSA
jgi:rubrerythrin